MIRTEIHIEEASRRIQDTIRERMEDAVNIVKGECVKTLAGPRTGRRYKVPGSNTYYTASSPGEPPARATGRLAQSIATEVTAGGTIGRVGTNLDYGRELESGTRSKAARPWLKVSFEKAREEVKNCFSSRWF